MYQGLSTRHDWPVKKRPFQFAKIRSKGNWKLTSGNSLSLLGAQNKDIGAALQTLLIEVKQASALWI